MQKDHICTLTLISVNYINNRRFPEITGEIIRKSEAPAVGHHSRHGLDLYTGIYILVHDFRMEAAVEKHWSVTVSDLQAWTYTILDCQLRTMCAKHFFFLRTTVFLVGPHVVCPFGMED